MQEFYKIPRKIRNRLMVMVLDVNISIFSMEEFLSEYGLIFHQWPDEYLVTGSKKLTEFILKYG